MRSMTAKGAACAVVITLGALAGKLAPTPLAGQSWTEDERKLLLEYLHASEQDFLASLQDLSEEQWNFRPAEDRWSVGQVAEHLALTEELVFGLLAEQLPTAGPIEAGREDPAEMDRMIREGLRDRS